MRHPCLAQQVVESYAVSVDLSIRSIGMLGQIMASVDNMTIDEMDITVHKEAVSKIRHSLLAIR